MIKIRKLHWTTYVLGVCVITLIGLCIYSFLERSLLEAIALSVFVILSLSICSIPFILRHNKHA